MSRIFPLWERTEDSKNLAPWLIIWNSNRMKKTLLETNTYLKDAKKRHQALTGTVRSSSAVEGIFVKRDARTGRFVSSKKKSTPKATKSSEPHR